VINRVKYIDPQLFAAWLIAALLGVPACIALGLWLLGIPIDWTSWKTYAGIASLTVAMVWAGN
jgi:hypothetical protein